MMSQDKLIEAIEHYQRNLNRGLKEENTAKLLHCIFKLSNMPITVAHLEHTGVGRTVNAMRKLDGEVGDAARELVNKWKLMVSQNQDCDETNTSESNNKSDSSQRSSDKTKSKERYKQETRERSEERDENSGSESENSSSESSDNSEDDEEEKRRSESPPRKHERNYKEDDRRKEHKRSDYKEKVSNSERQKEYKDKHRDRKEEKEKEKYRSRSPEKDRKKESSKRKRESDDEEKHAKKSKSHHREETKHKREKDRHSESRHKEKDTKKESRRDDVKSKSREKLKGGTEEPPMKPKVHRNENGICSESGTSFAEALGMLEPSTSKGAKKIKPEKPREKEKSPEKQKETPSRSESKEKPKKETTSSSSSKQERDKKSMKLEVVVPPPPPKNDLDINISSLLPTITPNYRPLANPLYDSPQNCKGKMLNDDEALSLVMSQKNQRTKVYSGNKMFWGSVPTLFELCIRVLQDNIDALEYTGGVPFAILKPVLDKATPQQLYMMEHYNPYLIEDTDDIWEFHCSKQFKNKKREELESWRDMYMRCLDEREAKLKALTENIKVAQEKSTPVRQTKLAYIDSVVKPPRDIIRKQAKNGIDKKPLVTPQSRLNAIASGSSNAQVSVPNPVRASSSNSSAVVKPKKAPLMQKTLAFLKGGRFRR